MYLRFITEYVDKNGDIDRGIFNVLRFIREDSATQDDDADLLKNLMNWFNNNLDAPDKFSNATNKNPESISLSWFKDSAKKHIGKIYEIRGLLSKYGIEVEVLTTKTPGYIIYEDDYQISAIPFKADRSKVI